jgi:nitronate monooxygenase
MSDAGLSTAFTRLVGCRLPIQQAGMGGVGTTELAAAVSEAGALGMLAGNGRDPAAVQQAAEQVRVRTPAPFGISFLVPFLEDRAVVACAAEQAAVVEFFYGAPDAALVALVHAGGALACWQVGSVREARAAAEAGCDLVVAQGVEAGGHVRGEVGVLPLLDDVLAAVDVPVLAAGGIGSGRSLAAVLAAGAAGARVGTRFVAAAESAAHPDYVAALAAADGADTVLTKAFSHDWPDAPHRVLRASLEAAQRFDGEVTAEVHVGERTVAVPRWHTYPPAGQIHGAIEALPHYAGQAVGAVRGVQPAGEIVAELADEAAALLGQR